MPACTLNYVTFNGKVSDGPSVLRAPFSIEQKKAKVGLVHEAEDGTKTPILRATTGKRSWVLTWKRVPEATRAAVETTFDLNTTFVFTWSRGTYIAQNLLDTYTEAADPLPHYPMAHLASISCLPSASHK